jgi:single-strand DNA-binding protein
MGNITRDIELRALPSGNSVATIGLAVNRKWRDQQSGEMREEVTFVDCEAFGKTAENISKFFAKGRPIFLEGRLKLDTWQDKTDGSKRSKLKVVIESFDFIDSKPGGGGGGAEGAPRATVRPAGGAARPAAAAQPAYEEIQADDIPF